MRLLTTEQLLAVADTFRTRYPARVRSFSALAACAAVPGARVHGIAVHDGPSQAAADLESTIRALNPLTSNNEQFARICGALYRELADD